MSSAFSFEDRLKIEQMLKDGCSYLKIAQVLGRARSGVVSEIKHFPTGEYTAEKAVARSKEILRKRREVYNKKPFTEEQKKIVEIGMKEGWTMSQVAKKCGVGVNRLGEYLSENSITLKTLRAEAIIMRVDALEMQMEIISSQLKTIIQELITNPEGKKKLWG